MIHKVRTPLFPKYGQAAAFMRATTGVAPKLVRGMITALQDQRGTPQDQVDWSNPDEWIPERLTGVYADLALKIWRTDGGVLNPRHCYGCWMFVNNFELTDGGDVWQPSEKGRRFLSSDQATLKELDDLEGIIFLLELLTGKEQARRADILPDWMDFLHQYSRFSSESTGKSALYARVANMIDRGLVQRDGMSYQITDRGVEWLSAVDPSKANDPKQEILRAVNQYNLQQKQTMKALLGKMDPYAFEQLIGQLLEAMGYQDVEVTKASGDKGVDVVGKVQVGISTVTEVVQVKRHAGSVGRPVVDQLRGALPYHKAIRGTIITTGKFASNCEQAAIFPGASPITLIDGDRLLELLIEHEVGVSKSKRIELLELNMEELQPSEGLDDAH